MKQIKEHGVYATTKGHAHIPVRMYRGWQIRRIAGGPGYRVDCPTFIGVLVDSKTMEGHSIETPTSSKISRIIHFINHFENSEFAEGQDRTVITRKARRS